MQTPYLGPPHRSHLGTSGPRVVRNRQGSFDQRLDSQQSDHPRFTTARKLVQVYNGGSMPNAPDKWYFTHPVELNGNEQEGAGATPVVDTTTTIPVVVVGGIPSVGDFLTAYAVGGRWVAEHKGTPPPSCTWFCTGSPPSSLVVTIASPSFAVGPITLPFAGGTPGDPGYCYWGTTVSVNVPSTSGCGALTAVTFVLYVIHTVGAWSLFISPQVDFAVDPQITSPCGTISPGVYNCLILSPGNNSYILSRGLSCSARPYSQTFTYNAIFNASVLLQCVYYLLFGGTCPGSGSDVLTITLGEP